jgi:hypothetical protein
MLTRASLPRTHTSLDRGRAPGMTTTLIQAARRVFQVDIAKARHHGAADVSNRFLADTNPVATVISNGDAESYAHPRAYALGASGKHDRGSQPLVFSTELGRSTPSRIKHPTLITERIRELRELIPETTGRTRKSERASPPDTVAPAGPAA